MIDRNKLLSSFSGIDEALDRPQTLCLIGASAFILLGLNARQTEDIDVWKPGSQILESALEKAAQKQGLAYNPTTFEPKPGYIQIIDPGIVQMPPLRDGLWPTGEPSRTLWAGDKLSVVCPPPAILIASKMLRATPVDMDDAAGLMLLTATPRPAIVAAIRTFPAHVRTTMRENMPLLDVMLPQARISSRPTKRGTQHERD